MWSGENRLQASRQLHRAGDSEQMEEMLESYENKTAQESYREAAARGCRQYLERHIQPKLAVQCAAALGKAGLPVGRAAGRCFGHRPKGGAP